MKFIYIILFALAGISGFSQEILTGLSRNPVVWEKARELSMQKNVFQGNDTVPVVLPFHDDFSQGNVFPSPDRWIDREAYVNTDYPLYPVNLGVVTLDAINDSGNMYPTAIPGPSTFIADHLTSRYIRLDSVFSPVPRKLNPADSVYLSFYFQPQGRGQSLSSTDSLSIRFLLKAAYDTIEGTDTIHYDDEWRYVWSSRGMGLDTFYINGGQWFRRVMIPIKDIRYFRKDFRFQFYNHVSLASNSQPSWQSNADPWNIDEVYLNHSRSKGDTLFPEIRFIERPPSMLENYTAMPYTQYSDDPGGEMADTISVLLTNRDIITHPATYGYTVQQPGGTFSSAWLSPAFPMASYLQGNFGTNLRAPVNFVFPISNADSNLFLVTHAVREESGTGFGDTLQVWQRFFNYFAYDDGTPEEGYGLKGAGGMLAYRFRLNVSPDTLRAVRIYFNRTLAGVATQFFYLTVWNDNNNKPGDTIYSRLVPVAFTDSLNNFVTYVLENPVRISGTFYVGTIQLNDDNLNIGFDAYNQAQSEMLFNVNGTWQSSVMSGALMIRPVVGKPLPVGTGDRPEADAVQLTVYPNPVSEGMIRIRSSLRANEIDRIVISNIAGMIVMNIPFSSAVNVSELSSGLYLVTLVGINGERATTRLIISR